MFLAFTYLFVGLMVVGIPAVIFLAVHKPKPVTYLSPAAYDEQMINLEFLRRNAIEAATSQVQVDKVNESYDSQEAQYRIRRKA
jgi:hypothetical protein